MQIDLRPYVVYADGPWKDDPESFKPNRLRLGGSSKDVVQIVGPLSLKITVAAENMMMAMVGVGQTPTESAVFCYSFQIPAGRAWRYHVGDTPTAAVLTNAENASFPTPVLAWPGANQGWRIVIEPGLADCCVPPSHQPECCCDKCKPACPPSDVPCDFAVSDQPNVSRFFPSCCEPCPPGAMVVLPPMGTALPVPPATGGCVRPLFFDGMTMTADDMNAGLKYTRLKQQLQNRAAGEGVVWGLNVCLDGSTVVVFPGYGVDCCGHDLTITTQYRVPSNVLVADPAARQTLSQRGDHTFHLLLEYFECPEGPRPVHGDPCSPETTACQMSRIRETARLRLVPPREFDDKGPIDRFFDKVRPAPKKLTPAAIAAAMHAMPAATTTAPFQVTFGILGTQGPVSVPMRDSGSRAAFDVNLLQDQKSTFQIQADPGWQVTVDHPTMVTPAGVWPPGTPVLATPSPTSWTLTLVDPSNSGAVPGNAKTFPLSLSATYKATNGTQQVTGTIDLSITEVAKQEGEFNFTATTALSWKITAQAATTNLPWPCMSESCDPTKPRFPTIPPWMDKDDPKVLALAMLYGWLAQELVRHKWGTPQQINDAEVQNAWKIYKAAEQMYFNVNTPADQNALSQQLQALFRDWCCSLLYPGPSCDHKEPHGVVIGCAVVNASGDIVSVDPWGGRRWVVHYPLLSYWGEQFGIVPLDVQASRLFGLICCIGGLPAPAVQVEQIPITGVLTGFVGNNAAASELPLGAGRLLFGGSSAVTSRLGQLGIQPAARAQLGMLDFVLRTLGLLEQPPAAPGTGYTLYTVDGFPDAALLVPDRTQPVGSTASVRAKSLVDSSLATSAGAPALPPLLRSFTTNLALAILDRTNVPSSVVTDTLAGAGMTNLRALLDTDPEALHRDVLGGAEPQAFSQLVTNGEALAGRIARAVAEAVRDAGEKGAATRDDLRVKKTAESLAKGIATKLKAIDAALPADAISQAITAALDAP